MPIHVVVDQDDFEKQLALAGDKLVVVEFTATWCGPCKQIGPEYKKLSEEEKNVIFLKVDVDDAQEVAASCGINRVPTFHFYKNKENVGESTGADINKLRSKVVELR